MAHRSAYVISSPADATLAETVSAIIQANGIPAIRASVENSLKKSKNCLFVLVLASDKLEECSEYVGMLAYAVDKKVPIVAYKLKKKSEGYLAPLLASAIEVDVSDCEYAEDGIPELEIVIATLIDKSKRAFSRKILLFLIFSVVVFACVVLGSIVSGKERDSGFDLEDNRAPEHVSAPVPENKREDNAELKSGPARRFAEEYLRAHPLSAAEKIALDVASSLAEVRVNLARVKTAPGTTFSLRITESTRAPFTVRDGSILHWLALQEIPELTSSVKCNIAAQALVAGVDIEKKDASGISALFVACVYDAELAAFFLDAGADPVYSGKSGLFTPIFAALRWNTPFLVRKIADNLPGGWEQFCRLRINSDLGWGVRPLHLSALAGTAESIKMLLDAGADASQRDNCGRTPLHCLVTERQIIKANAGTYRYWDKAVQNYSRATRLLVAAGADINAQTNDKGDNSGKCGHRSWLSVHIPDDGRTALHIAAAGGDVQMVKLLLSLGAGPNIKNARGETPLSFMKNTDWTGATEAEKTEIEKIFLRKNLREPL